VISSKGVRKNDSKVAIYTQNWLKVNIWGGSVSKVNVGQFLREVVHVHNRSEKQVNLQQDLMANM
jgi:hypothetical protein